MKKIILPSLLISLIALTILALPTNPIHAEDPHDHSNETPEEHAVHAGHEETPDDHESHDAHSDAENHEPQNTGEHKIIQYKPANRTLTAVTHSHDHSNETPEEHASHAGHEETPQDDHDDEGHNSYSDNFRLYLWSHGSTTGYNPNCEYNSEGKCQNQNSHESHNH